MRVVRLLNRDMSNLKEIWGEVTNLLQEARGYLSPESSLIEEINDSEFRSYLEHNELELALDEIERLSDDFEPLPREFWQCLVKAANRMELSDHSKRYLKLLSYYK